MKVKEGEGGRRRRRRRRKNNNNKPRMSSKRFEELNEILIS